MIGELCNFIIKLSDYSGQCSIYIVLKQCASGPVYTELGSFVGSMLPQRYIYVAQHGSEVPTQTSILCLWTRITTTDARGTRGVDPVL